MDIAEFAALVARMRALQVKYFKDAEKRVDRAIDTITGKADQQQGLF